MNQAELNRIAINLIKKHSFEVAQKLEKVLAEDVQERAKELPGMTVHHIHNMALYDLLLIVNSIFLEDRKSAETASEYCQLGESLRPKFLEIVEALKDRASAEETTE